MKNKLIIIVALGVFLYGCTHADGEKIVSDLQSEYSIKQLSKQNMNENAAQKNSTPEKTTAPIAPSGYDPYRLAQFPMGCQYKGYELCNPIYDPAELGDENIDLGDGYIYAPMTRLYFPDDWLFSGRESTPETAEIDDYVGEWWQVSRHDLDGEIKRLADDSLEIRYYKDIFTCTDQIVKGRNYLIYYCHMDKEFSARYNTIRPVKKPYDVYINLKITLKESSQNKDMDSLTVTIVKYLPCLQFLPSIDNYWIGKGYNGTYASTLCKTQEYPFKRITSWQKMPWGE